MRVESAVELQAPANGWAVPSVFRLVRASKHSGQAVNWPVCEVRGALQARQKRRVSRWTQDDSLAASCLPGLYAISETAPVSQSCASGAVCVSKPAVNCLGRRRSLQASSVEGEVGGRGQSASGSGRAAVLLITSGSGGWSMPSGGLDLVTMIVGVRR